MGTASLQIFGMTESLMNQLSTLGMKITLLRRNGVTVEAGDEVNGMSTVFVGTVTNAWADLSAAPDVPFNVEAHAGLIEALTPVPVSSFKGTTNVATVMLGIATQMGLAFENNGVSVSLANPYFPGTAREQALAAAKAAGIEWAIDNGKLAIWKPGSIRGQSYPLLSKESGMVGYPTYTSQGITVRSLYNPSIGFGGGIEVKSDLTPANGKWVVFLLEHNLSSQVPRGPWFSTISAVRPGLGPVVS